MQAGVLGKYMAVAAQERKCNYGMHSMEHQEYTLVGIRNAWHSGSVAPG